MTDSDKRSILLQNRIKFGHFIVQASRKVLDWQQTGPTQETIFCKEPKASFVATTFSIATPSITTLSIFIFSITISNVALSKHNDTDHLSVNISIKLSMTFKTTRQSVVRQSVVRLSVMAPVHLLLVAGTKK